MTRRRRILRAGERHGGAVPAADRSRAAGNRGRGRSAGTLKEEGRQRTITQLPLDVTPYEPLKAELEAFVGACLGGEVRYVDGREGRQALETALAVRDAIRG